MTSKPETNGDESFIILGSSPGTSLDLKCNGIEGPSLDRVALDDAMKDLSPEASTAFKAHFKLEDGPSPASLMAASSIITDDTSTEQLQKHFGELLDENVILKETLKKNNDSMKEQFLLIASCQEDMMKTHMLHKEKFDETRMLVEKLRQENKRLKLDIVRLAESEQSASGPTSAKSSGPPSALEFVTSPDDDTINKLTAQLELVEKQRRQVIVENEKLTWQKESLEHIIDATSKERDDLKEKLKNSELKLLSIESEHDFKVTALNNSIQDLESKLEAANRTIMEKRPDIEIKQRNEMIMQLEQKVSALQNDLKMAQLKILELEDVKLKFVAYKSNTSSSRKSDEETILMLVKKLKEASDTVFTPARCTVSAKDEARTLEGLTEYEKFKANVKLYDKTLKHLATYINSISSGSVDMLVEGIGVVASIQEMPMDGPHAEQFKSSLGHLKERIEKMYDVALKNINQVKSSLSIFEGMFLDHVDILKKLENSPETRKRSPPPQTTDQLTNALLARGQEIQLLKSELVALRDVGDDRHVLQAQIDLYKSDFEAERQAREKMASEKENILTDLRSAQRLNQEYKIQLEEVRKLNPNIYRSATTKKMPPSLYPGTGTSNTRPTTGTGSAWTRPSGTQGARRQSAPGTATGNMVRKKQKVSEGEEKETTPPPLRFDCPVCDQPFKSLILLQQHVETCLL